MMGGAQSHHMRGFVECAGVKEVDFTVKLNVYALVEKGMRSTEEAALSLIGCHKSSWAIR